VTIGAQTDLTVTLGNLKKTYMQDMEDNRPIWAVLQERLEANREGIEVGDTIQIPVILTHQAGETYDNAGGTRTLRAPVSMEIKDASTEQYEITQPVRMPFGVISKVEQSKKARFADKARLMLLAGQTGAKRSLELALLHGNDSIAKVTTGSAATTGAGPYTRVININPAFWSDGIWGAIENAPVDVYSALSSGTQRNANGDMNVVAADFVNKTVTLQSGTSADLTNITSGDFIFPASAYGFSMNGLMYFLRNASSTGQTILGLSTNYSMWRSKSVTVSGPITFGKLLSGVTPAVAHGANGRLTVFANSRNGADLHKDFLSTRRLDASYSEDELKNGARKITYRFQKLTLELVTHDFMFDGDVAVVPEDNWFRAGSDPDPTMTLGGKELSVMSSTSNSFEFRWFSASVLVPNLLATSVLFTGITPAAS
jgi:hypothetical protein